MRTLRTSLACLVVLAGVVAAQPPGSGGGAGSSLGPRGGGGSAPTKKSALETALEEAFKNNPDLRVAEAKLIEAQAQVARARLQVAQKVVVAFQEIESARANLNYATAKLDRLKKLGSSRAVAPEEVTAAEQEMIKARAALDAAEAQLNYLTGKTSEKHKTLLKTLDEAMSRERERERALFRVWNIYSGKELVRPREMPKGAFIDRLRTALETTMTYPENLERFDAFPFVAQKAGIVILAPKNVPAKDLPSVELKDQTVAAVLQFLEDHMEDHVIIVREYGLRVLPKDKVPADAVTLAAFRKGLANPADAPAKGKATEPVEGKVDKVDSDLVIVSIGADAGLTKGQSLEVFRLAPMPKYLGRLTVFEVQPTRAVAKVVGKLAGNLAAGDRVTTKLTGK